MKRKLNRKKTAAKLKIALYSVLGVAISASILYALSVNIPPLPQAKTDLNSFPGGVLDVSDDETIDRPTPPTPTEVEGIPVKDFILGDNSYHVTQSILDNFIELGLLSYGRVDPLRYSKSGSVTDEAPPSEGDEEEPDVIIEEEPEEQGPEKPPGGIQLETPNGIINLEYTSGSLPVKSQFYKVDKIYGLVGSDFHYGIDIHTEDISGAEVYSILPGVVSNVGENDEYGNFIVVNHGSISSLYAHLEPSIALKVGDRVFTGDLLGHVGTTGNVEKPHLHFEMDEDGIRFNPEIFINKIN